jgi:hypothetical protein
VILSPVFADGI